jgi:photosystem I subunit 8
MKNINSNPLKIKNMTATFLPAILVPIVGLVFPAISMALFFLYVSVDDIN